jgi:hypothetical protein
LEAGAAATGAAATASVFLATVFVDLAPELIIPEAEEVDEDILRRTYCYSELENHFLFDYLHRALPNWGAFAFYFEV